MLTTSQGRCDACGPICLSLGQLTGHSWVQLVEGTQNGGVPRCWESPSFNAQRCRGRPCQAKSPPAPLEAIRWSLLRSQPPHLGASLALPLPSHTLFWSIASNIHFLTD